MAWHQLAGRRWTTPGTGMAPRLPPGNPYKVVTFGDRR